MKTAYMVCLVQVPWGGGVGEGQVMGSLLGGVRWRVFDRKKFPPKTTNLKAHLLQLSCDQNKVHGHSVYDVRIRNSGLNKLPHLQCNYLATACALLDILHMSTTS